MTSVSMRLTYRPIKIGWCLAHGDVTAFRRAVRLSCTLAGGGFCPIIVTDDAKHARAMIDLYRIDVLMDASADALQTHFIAGYPHLKKPSLIETLFAPRGRGRTEPNYVDVTNIMSRIQRDFFEGVDKPDVSFRRTEWNPTDPLADVFLATFGAFPSKAVTGTAYDFHFGFLRPDTYRIPDDGNVPDSGWKRGPADISRWGVAKTYLDHPAYTDLPGFYIGDAGNFDDLVHYWNLQAAGLDLTFCDPRFEGRFREQIKERSFSLGGTYRPDGKKGVNLWVRRNYEVGDRPATDAEAFWKTMPDVGEVGGIHFISDATWNGLNLKVPQVSFKSASTLAATDFSVSPPRLTFSLPDRPFEEDSHFEHYIVDMSFGFAFTGSEQLTTSLPYLPDINPFYSQQLLMRPDSARIGLAAVGIFTSTATNHMSVRGMEVIGLAMEIFRSAGIDLKLSKAGLVIASLIRQMGGLDSCRPFKIEGVRELIKFRPDQSFSRSDAMLTIMGQGNVTPLSDYQWLSIEKREPGVSLTNSAVLDYLLDRGVFRPGLKFDCPNCRLDFWLTLDASKARVECEYCGEAVNTSRQLKDKGWAFRRSGLFGRDDNQEGGIPVTLTLQQLGMVLAFQGGFYIPASNLSSLGASIPTCETDFCIVSRRDKRIQIVIGECKNQMSITEADVTNLLAVAKAFPSETYDVFIVFSKLGDFEADELQWIEQVNAQYQKRAIIMTRRELEPFIPYQLAAGEFEIDFPIVWFEDMARATDIIFFKKQRRLSTDA